MRCPYCYQDSEKFQPNAFAGYTQGGQLFVEIFTSDANRIKMIVPSKQGAFAVAKEHGVEKDAFQWLDRRRTIKGW